MKKGVDIKKDTNIKKRRKKMMINVNDIIKKV